MTKLVVCLLSALFVFYGAIALAGQEPAATPGPELNHTNASVGSKIGYQQPKREFRHVVRKDISPGEKLITLGLVYAAQWGYYLGFQWSTIREKGSFENWYTNMYRPHFDKDSYNYNLVFHTLTGTSYYLFFRSRGYTKGHALAWSFLSQFLFEFTIETVTEKPSFQDLFQTPVLGTVLGITLEHLSNSLLGTDCVFLWVLGYILNPFALFPFSSYEAVFTPTVEKNGVVYGAGVRF